MSALPGALPSALHSKRVVVTRAAHQAADLNALLIAKGAEPVPFPCIAISPPDDTHELDTALSHLEAFDYLILTSANTVYALAQRLEALKIAPELANIRIAAVGEATADAAREWLHVEVDTIPDEAYAHALADALHVEDGMRVLLPQSALAHTEMAQRIQAKGAVVSAITAYENTTGSGGADVVALIHAGKIDTLTFTSSSTVENFLKRIEHDPDAVNIALTLPAACIGAKTRETALEYGFQTTITPENPGLETMVDALADYFKAFDLRNE